MKNQTVQFKKIQYIIYNKSKVKIKIEKIMMNPMYQIYKYQQSLQQIRQQLNPNYFSSQQLKEQIIKTQKDIEMMMKIIQDFQQKIQERKKNEEDPILVHPKFFIRGKVQRIRQVCKNQFKQQQIMISKSKQVQASVSAKKGSILKKSKSIQKQRQKTFQDTLKMPHANLLQNKGINLKKLFQKNTKMSISIIYEKLHPNNSIKSLKNFKIHMHYGNKLSYTKKINYNQVDNIHNDRNLQRISYQRQFFNRVEYSFSQSVYDLNIGLIEQSRVYLFLQAQNEIIIGQAILNFQDIFDQEFIFRNNNVSKQAKKDQFLKSFLIEFYEPRATAQIKNASCSKKLIGVFDAYIHITFQILPIEIENLLRIKNNSKGGNKKTQTKSLKQIYMEQKKLEKMNKEMSLMDKSVKIQSSKKILKKSQIGQHSPRKIIQNNGVKRSHSPSPSRSPQTKKHLLKQLISEHQQFTIKCLNKKPLKVQINWDLDIYSDIQPVYEKTVNIKARQIHVIKQKEIWFLQILIQLSNQVESLQGLLQFTLQKKAKYTIKITKDQTFKFVSQDQARKSFKSLNENCLIKISERVLVYPDEKVHILRNPIPQKIQRGCYTVHFIKSQYDKISISTFPYDIQYQYIKKQGGFMICYKVFRGQIFQTIAFAIKGQNSSFIDINIIQVQIQQPGMKHSVIKQLYVNVINQEKNKIENFQKRSKNSLEIFYKIDMSGIAKQNCKTRIRSLNDNKSNEILKIVNGQNFIYTSNKLNLSNKTILNKNQYLIVQLIKNIQEENHLTFYIDDIDKKMTSLMILKVIPKFDKAIDQSAYSIPKIIKENKQQDKQKKKRISFLDLMKR